jgi:hypothetical protein
MAGIIAVADVLVARALCSGLPQSLPAGHAADPDIAALIVRTNLRYSTNSFTLAYPLIRYVDCKSVFKPGGRSALCLSLTEKSRLPMGSER